MSASMRRAIKILNLVSGFGFDRKKPEDQEKRSSLVYGLLMTKYERARHTAKLQREAEIVKTETI